MEKDMTFKIKNLLVFFLLMLPLANLPQLFNLGEDLGSIFISIFIFIIFLLWVIFEKKLIKPTQLYNQLIILIIAIGILFNFISIIFGIVDLQDGIRVLLTFSLPKLIFLYLIIVISERVSVGQAFNLFFIFLFITLLSTLVSPLFYQLNPIPEFIFYDGNTRFAGFHFELVNFTFSLLVGFFIFSIYKGFSPLILLVTLVIIYFLGRSNAFFPFVLLSLAGVFLARFRIFSISRLFVLSILILTPLIGFFIEFFEFLEIFALREATSFTLEGSTLFIRLYPWALATEHLVDNFFKMPIGLGMLGISPYMEDTENLFGGTGITAILAEYGFLSIFIVIFLYFYFIKIVKNIFMINDPNLRLCLMGILSLSLTYICIQSGFFNLTAWTLCIMVHTISVKLTKATT